MNVTSILSSGYLQPSHKPQTSTGARGSAASLAMQEQQILAQERTLKTSSGSNADVSTTYRYSVGPDGRRYITGAEVTIKGDERTVDGIGGGVKREELQPRTASSDETREDASVSEEGSAAEVIRELKQTEREVVAHEAAHQAAGGRFAGAVSYSYTRGPDGKSYITGGEVPINVPASSDPEQTLRDMAQVQRAAMAPGSPSGQDIGVAAQASAVAAQARQDLAASKNETRAASAEKSADSPFKSGLSSVQAGLRFDRIQADEKTTAGEEIDGRNRPLDLSEPREAYALYASKLGLWTVDRGFEGGSVDERSRPRWDFAA